MLAFDQFSRLLMETTFNFPWGLYLLNLRIKDVSNIWKMNVMITNLRIDPVFNNIT